jgi:TonB-dependent SusC/RagA subfamily outer membrane receptor
MLPYFWYILKVIICSGILFGYYWLFLRNKIFHQYNRFYLLAALVLSQLLPLLRIDFWQQVPGQSQVIKVLQVVSEGDDYMNNVIITANNDSWNIQQLYPVIYWIVTMVLFLVLLQTLFIIRSLLKKYPVQLIDKFSFVNTDDKNTPFSFLKYIFWNSNIDMDTPTGKQIFKHEVAHIQEKHTYDKLFVNIILIFFWCNPFFWLYRKELNMIHEFIADRKAVEDSDTASFAAMILQAAYPQHRFQLTNNFFYSPIKRRLLMLTKKNNPRVNYFGRIMVLPLAVLVFTAFSLKSKTNNDAVTAKSNIVSEVTGKPDAITLINSLAKSSDEVKNPTDTLPNKNIAIAVPKGKQPIYILNGNEVDTNTVTKLDQNEIESINILKDKSAFDKYGERGNNGVIEITLKKNDIAKTQQPQVALALDKMNVFYIGVDNPVTIAVPGVPSDRLLVNMNNGLISGSNGKYIVRVTTLGEATIKVSTIKNDQRVALSTQSFRVKRIPDPVDGKLPIDMDVNYSIVPKFYFGDVKGVRSEVEFFKRQKEIRISEGYKLVNAQVYFSGAGFANVITATLSGSGLNCIQGLLDKCEGGTVVSFDNIKVRNNEGTEKIINGISFSLYAVDGNTDKTLIEVKEQKILLEQHNSAKLDYAEKQLLAKNADVALEKAMLERKLNDQELQNLKQKLLLEQQNNAKLAYTENAILYEKQLQAQQNNMVFTKAEVSPQYTGGDEAWAKFLRENIRSATPVEEGWKAGKFIVTVKFIIHTDGTISDITTENYKGSKTAQHCIDVIKNAPKWQPAIQNGKKVNAYKKQPIIFVIEK